MGYYDISVRFFYSTFREIQNLSSMHLFFWFFFFLQEIYFNSSIHLIKLPLESTITSCIIWRPQQSPTYFLFLFFLNELLGISQGPTFSQKVSNIHLLRGLWRSSRRSSADGPQLWSWGEGSAPLTTSYAAHLLRLQSPCGSQWARATARPRTPPRCFAVLRNFGAHRPPRSAGDGPPGPGQALASSPTANCRYGRLASPIPHPVRTTVRTKAERGWCLEPRSASPGRARNTLVRASPDRKLPRPRNTAPLRNSPYIFT